ncbi:70 kDa heat shock protein [Gryllus bimaculatus]|nr:70 kDa heat shock protein [Gryllus bimaculatus]
MSTYTFNGIKRILGMDFYEVRRKNGMKFCPFHVITDRKETKIKVTEIGKFQRITTTGNCRGLSLCRIECSSNNKRFCSCWIFAWIISGTFDVSILRVANGAFEVKATTGDGHLGGEDFDVRLVSHFAEEIRQQHGRDITGDARAVRVLRAACERAKRALSDADEATVAAELHGLSFRATLTRQRFEALCHDLFLLLFQHLENVLFVANVLRGEIDRVVLAGGATRMPKIREMIGVFFDKEIAQPVSPETTVVTGAAMQAAIVYAQGPVVMSPLSIGIEAPGAAMTVIIPRRSELPVKKTVNYTTYHDYQQAITLNVFEGERLLATSNTMLGTLTLDGIPLLPRGIPQIDITFDLDSSGLLTVTACERSTGIKNHFVAITSKDHIGEEQVERVLAEAEYFREDDENERDRLVARDLFKVCLLNVKRAMNAPDVVESMDVEDHAWYMHMLRSDYQWLKSNLSAKKEEFMRRRIDLQIVYLSIVADMFHDDLNHELRCRREG